MPENPEGAESPPRLALAPGPASFDFILSNPPFGIDARDSEMEGGLAAWELSRCVGRASAEGEDTDGRKPRKTVPTSVKAEVLFCEQIRRLLRPGTGRAAVVLPDSLLANPSLVGVRKWLMAHFQVMAVVSVPPETFASTGTTTKTSVVLLRKLGPGEALGNYGVFMAIAKNVGHDSRGRSTCSISKAESGGRVEVHSMDLFDSEVTFVRDAAGGWKEARRRVLDGTGLLGQYLRFEQDPASLPGTDPLDVPAVGPGDQVPGASGGVPA